MSATSYQVHLGFWTNWSRGSTLGATITLTQGDANILIALISLFVTLVGTRLFRVICLVTHFNFSSSTPQDALHHQRQATLRNLPDAIDGVFVMASLAKAWRKQADKTWRRSLPLLVFSLFWFCAWTVAAGFSSQISTAIGNEVLLSGSSCGYLDETLDWNLTDVNAFFFPHVARQIQSSATYAQECYSETSEFQNCATFVKRKISSTVVSNASCPFDDKICLNQDANLVLDTGYLDSHKDFGLNTPPNQRFKYRRVVQCAPLVTEGYMTIVESSATNRSYTRYWYGQQAGSGEKVYVYQYANDPLADLTTVNDLSKLPQPDYSIGQVQLLNCLPRPMDDLDRTNAATLPADRQQSTGTIFHERLLGLSIFPSLTRVRTKGCRYSNILSLFKYGLLL